MPDGTDEFGNEEPDGIKNLRKEHKARGEEIENLKKTLAQFEATTRQQTLETALKEAKLDTRYAAFYAGDDVSKEAVSKWLDANKELFTVALKTEGDGQQSGGDDKEGKPGEEKVDQATREAARRAAELMGPTEESVQPVGISGYRGNPEELANLLANTPQTREGYRQLVQLGIMPDVEIQPGSLK
jgi:hypothetical protein